MSSLAATQADGYYAPPEYYESGAYQKKSVSQFNDEKSKGNNQYLKHGIVRFELPYDGFCQACGEHVGKGTRFNAKKSQNGACYFSTPVYKFSMTCRVCNKCEFVIQTNPKERSFDYLEGIHKQVQEFDTRQAGTAGVIDTDHGNKLVEQHFDGADDDAWNALSRLESVACGARKTMTERDQLESLMSVRKSTFLDDSGSNAALRKTFRADRNSKKQRLNNAKALGWKEGIELADETVDDIVSARGTCFGKGSVTEKKKFKNIRTSSIFDKVKPKKTSRRRARDDTSSSIVRPDQVSSIASSTIIMTTDAVVSAGTVKQEEKANRKRIRLVPQGATLKRGDCSSANASEKTCQDRKSSFATLLEDYASDSD
jgi:hypothetical protein